MKPTHKIILKKLLENKGQNPIRHRAIYNACTDQEKLEFDNNPKSVSDVSRYLSKMGYVSHISDDDFGNPVHLLFITDKGEDYYREHCKEEIVINTEPTPVQKLEASLMDILAWVKPYFDQPQPPVLKYKVGDRVVKVGGDYSLTGTIVAAFTKASGAERYVVEADNPKGLLHIYSENNLQIIPDDQEAAEIAT